jgi:hypothetical protein
MNAPVLKRWKNLEGEYVSTLVYLDAPQVVVLDHGYDSKIIGVAIEKEGFTYPFLGAEISVSQLQRYKREFVDLRYLFLLPRWRRWYLFDLAAMDENKRIKLKKADKADYSNNEYLPTHGFFARGHTEPATEEASAEITTQKFLIDGTWDPPDLSLFFARINDLYSFFLGIRKFLSAQASTEQKKALVDAFTDNSLHSGFNYVNLYGDLKGLLGFDERLAMGAIEKKSPGFVNIEGIGETLADVAVAFEAFETNGGVLKEQYAELHAYLSRMGLLKTDGHKRFDKVGGVARWIKEKNEKFAETLGLEAAVIDKLTHNNALLTAKILLSHHRRLERYHLFFVEGRVALDPSTALFVANSPSTGAKPDA